MVKETIEESSYEERLLSIREKQVKEYKRRYYIAHREKLIAYSKEYKKTYTMSDVQRRRYNLRQIEKYHSDPEFREKTLKRAKFNRKKKIVVKIIGILNGIIKSKEKV